MQEKYDYLLVGAGLYSAVFAHAAERAGKSCLVLENARTSAATSTAIRLRA